MRFALAFCLTMSIWTPSQQVTKGTASYLWGFNSDSKFPPAKWGEIYDTCTDNGNQSPVDIPKSAPVTQLAPAVAKFFEGEFEVIVENDGRNIRMTYICCETPFVSGGAQPKPQEHYFWFWSTVYIGEDSKSGSPHTIDGTGYPMELTIQFLKLNDPETPKDEQNSIGVSILFQETEEDNADIQPFVDVVKKVRNYDSVQSFRRKDLLQMFIPKEYQKTVGERLTYFNQFYHYKGSLLTPPCTDGVYWYVMKMPSKIGKNQLAELRKVQDENGKSVAGNRRPVQKLGDRKVISSDPRVLAMLGKPAA